MEKNVNCPRCGDPLTIDEELLGQPFTCPSCQGTVVIPNKKLPLPPKTAPLAKLPPPEEEPPVMPPYTGPPPMPPIKRLPEPPGERVTITDVKLPFVAVLYLTFQFALASLFIYVVVAFVLFILTGENVLFGGRF